ncbi:MAG TPA: hypothetical protein VGS17_11110 [Candidatus Limnocylindria bacterium]|nr:hypothetical protein [Candidatus Limnocylindria bacterium]
MTGNKWPLAIAAGAFTTALIGGVALAAFQPFATSDPATVGGPTAGLAENAGPKDKLKTVLDGLVAKGTITQPQEDAIVQAVKDAAPTPRPNVKPAGPTVPGLRSFVGDLTKAASDYLGMDLKTLATQLRAGKSVADIANGLADKSKNAAGLIATLTKAANDKLDQAVAASKLTADQAATLKPRIATAITTFVNRSFTKPVLPRPLAPVTPTPTPKS